VWESMEHPTVPGLDVESGFTAKRFVSCPLNYLTGHRKDFIKSIMEKEEITNVEKAIKFVIEKFKYPLLFGLLPIDIHSWISWFQKSHTAWFDYWQSAFETLRSYVLNGKGVGDCEDTSILLCAILELLEADVWVCFGVVFRGDSLLGRHAWVIVRFPIYWRLIETTLEKMPPSWPRIDPEVNTWTFGKQLKYVAFIRWNSRVYQEWRS